MFIQVSIPWPTGSDFGYSLMATACVRDFDRGLLYSYSTESPVIFSFICMNIKNHAYVEFKCTRLGTFRQVNCLYLKRFPLIDKDWKIVQCMFCSVLNVFFKFSCHKVDFEDNCIFFFNLWYIFLFYNLNKIDIV